MGVEARRGVAQDIFQAGLEAVDPARVVRRTLSWSDGSLSWTLPNGSIGRWERPPGGLIRVVGMGKAAAAMAAGVEAVLGPALEAGCVVVKDGCRTPTQQVKVLEAGHPVPDQRGLTATLAVESILRSMTARDLTIVLVSGGGSALLPAPVDGVTLQEKQRVTQDLLKGGVEIKLLNHVRRRLSRLKGGGMLSVAGAGTLLSLILSDVVGDPLDLIASGPTVPPEENIDLPGQLRQRGLWEALSPNLQQLLSSPRVGHDVVGDMRCGKVAGCTYHNVLVASNRECLSACQAAATERGYQTEIVTARLTGEARVVGEQLGRDLVHLANHCPVPTCRLYGGETVVTVRGQGRGGRCQELAVAAARVMEGASGAVLLAAGTDGTDGPTDAAGGLVDGGTATRIRLAGADLASMLQANDSYHCLQLSGDLLLTGATATNVMDVLILLADPTKHSP